MITNRIYRNLFLFAIFQLAASCWTICSGQDAIQHVPDTVRGTWALKSIYRTQNVEGPSSAEQRKLLGSKISINDRSLTACRQTVSITSVEIYQLMPGDFLANTLVHSGDVGLDTQRITEVIINKRRSGTCFEAFPIPGQDIYIKNRNELVISFEGVFYRAVRLNR